LKKTARQAFVEIAEPHPLAVWRTKFRFLSPRKKSFAKFRRDFRFLSPRKKKVSPSFASE
jgi:hypothetical protein